MKHEFGWEMVREEAALSIRNPRGMTHSQVPATGEVVTDLCPLTLSLPHFGSHYGVQAP